MAIFGALPIILQNGTLADANQVMADFNKIIGDGNANAAANGANADITSLSALTSPIPVVGGSSTHFLGATSGGTASAQTVATTVPSNWALTTNFMLSFNPGFSSTGATTLAVAGGSALAIRKLSAAGPVALQPNDIVAGQNVTVVYDGTAYLLISEPNDPLFGTLTNLASAATTDLGTIQSQNVNVTGTTTITSFGSSASIANPFFMVTFAGALTLTYNATSLIIPGSANLTTAAGDQALMEYLGSGNWKVAIYQKRDGTPIVSPAGTAGVLVGIQVFTANGTYTPNASATTAFAILTGGGGSGGTTNGGGGGGGGGTTIAYLSSLSVLGVTIGTGGAAVNGSNLNGNSGGTTSLGAITALGGAGGGHAGGTGGAGGGAGAGGVITIPGSAGGDGGSVATSPAVVASGGGGGSFWGPGGGAPSIATGSSGSVHNGTVYGAGGSGTNAISGNSGAGFQGVVVIFEFK